VLRDTGRDAHTDRERGQTNPTNADGAGEPPRALGERDEARRWAASLCTSGSSATELRNGSCLVSTVTADTEERQENTQEQCTEAYKNPSQGRTGPPS